MKKNKAVINNLIISIAFLLSSETFAQNDDNYIPAEQFVCLSNPFSFQIIPD